MYVFKNKISGLLFKNKISYLPVTYLLFKEDIHEAPSEPCQLNTKMLYYILVIQVSVF